MSDNLKKWEILSSEIVFDTKWFKIRKDKVLLPNGTIYGEYYVKERSDWAAIFGLTEDRELLLLRTYKHGSRSMVYELPSGSINEGEEPRDAIKRELLEETGFILDDADLIKVGMVLVDPTYVQANQHIFIGKNIKKMRHADKNPREIFQINFIPRNEILTFLLNNLNSFPESQIANILLSLDFLNKTNFLE
jgi:8-oxo-dGTP pyrophosphatase MutT (NUDIX family)